MSNRKLAVVISAAFTLLLTAKIIAEEPNYSWRQTDSSLALLNHERIVWQLNFDKKAGKTYFHPVALTDGTVLTWLSPPDHPWHRALWFSWKYINGLNYWEEDRKTGLSEGRTNLVDIKLTPHDDYSAQIEMNLSYHPPGKPAVLTEKRLISISKPDENGRYRIDWQSSFTAGAQDVLLDRTPIPGEKDGKSWGGYAGLSVRIAKDISDWQVLDSEGRKGIEAHGKKARWLDFSGQTANGKTAGITIFDHPDNLRHPSPWFVIMDSKVPFGYFSPAVLFHKPYTLAAGKSLELRYRIFIHPERGDKEMLEKEWKTFLKTTDIEVQFESAKMLKALGVAMVTYTGDAEIKFPDDMQPLHKYGSLSKRDLRWLTKNVAYVVKGKTTGNIRPNTVLAYDKTLLEKGEGTNVLFGDLRIEFLKPERLNKLGIGGLGDSKDTIRVDLLVCEVDAGKKIDVATLREVKELVGDKMEAEDAGDFAKKILRSGVQDKELPKDKLDSLVCLLGSKGYLKILMNPTLEVTDGNTGKARRSYKGPTGKDIVDSLEVTPRILEDGSISLAIEAAVGEMRISNDENRFKNGQSLIIGGIKKTPSDPNKRVVETLFIVTATICEGDGRDSEIVRER